MKKRGKNTYVPPNVFDELNNIMKSDGISKRCEGFNKMVQYAKVGREVKIMRDRMFLIDLIKKKRGNALDVGLTMIILFVFSLIVVIGSHSLGEFSDRFANNTIVNQSSPEAINAVQNVENTFNNRMDWVGFTLLIGLTLAIIITGWLVSGNAIFTFIYFIVLVILVVSSAIISFTWERFTDTSALTTAVNNFPVLDFLLSNLPMYIAIVGFIGMVVTFAKPTQ